MKMSDLQCELEHVHVAAVTDIVFLKFLKRDTFGAMDWVFLLASKKYFVLHSIFSGVGDSLSSGNSLASVTKT